LLALAAVLAACGQSSYTAAEHLERAREFSAGNDPVAAIIEVKNALQQEPGNGEARWLLGMLHLEVMDGATAYAELRRAADLGVAAERVRVPLLRAALLIGNTQEVIDGTGALAGLPEEQVTEALALRASALLMRGDLETARAVLAEAAARDETHRDVLYASAWADILSRRHTEARAVLTRLIELHPGYARGYELLGDMERDSGDLAAAEAAYTSALEVSRQPFSPRIKRAMVRIYREDHAAAKEDLDSLSRRYQKHPAIHFARGLIAFEERGYPDAQREFEQALALAPNHMLAVYYLGATHFAQGNWRIAENHLARFNARYPHVSDATRLLAMARAREGDLGRAESTLRTILQKDPKDVAALRLISGIQMSQGRDQEALAQLRQLVSLDPDSARARVQLGFALLEQGGRQEGMSELETAIALDPENLAGLEVALVIERIRGGEHDQALVALEALKARNPQDPLLSNLEGTAWLGKGDAAKAKAAFEEAVANMPGYAPAVRNLAAMSARGGDLTGAIAILQQGLSHSPEAIDLMLYLSSLQMRDGQLAQSYETLRRAVAADPEALAPRLALSGNRLAAGEIEAAIDVLNQVRELHGESPLWMRHMALAQGAAGNGEEAAALVRRLIENEPASADLHLALARALALTPDREGVRAALEQALEFEPGHLGAGAMLVRLHLAEGRAAEAAKVLQPLARSAGESAEVAMLTAQVAMAEHRFQDAAAAFRRVIRAEPESGPATMGLYQALWEGGDRAGAIAVARAWAESRPDDHVARYNLALLYMAGGEQTEAIRHMEEVARHLPENGAVLNNLAWLQRASDPDKALGLAERAVRLLPDSAAALHTLGTIQLDLGRGEEALSTLRKARDLDPSHAGVRYQYARALARSGRGEEARPLLEGLLEVDDAHVPQADVREMLSTL
jgi:putative PEP-CTERM system TPR-repeat lipoprotein